MLEIMNFVRGLKTGNIAMLSNGEYLSQKMSMKSAGSPTPQPNNNDNYNEHVCTYQIL